MKSDDVGAFSAKRREVDDEEGKQGKKRNEEDEE
jgi:hypothetical protein